RWVCGGCDRGPPVPRTAEETNKLGARWMPATGDQSAGRRQVFATRLHVRYDREHFPEDLMLMETRDASTFQGRYVLQHPFFGKLTCSDGETYRNSLRIRLTQEAAALAALPGRASARIRAQL